MDEFQFELQDLIARNKIDKVIKRLLSVLQKCEKSLPDSKEEMREMRNQVVMLSARYTETTDKINRGIISPIHADTAKNQLISAFLNVINKLPDSTHLMDYLNGVEEEEAWKVAAKANTIDAYRVFFSKYPHGKYQEETQRIISELESIQREKEKEIKQKAEEEKDRIIREEAKIKKEKKQAITGQAPTNSDEKQAAKIPQKTIQKETNSTSTQSSTSQAVPLAASAIASAGHEQIQEGFFKKIFNPHNRWWTLTALILAPMSSYFVESTEGYSILILLLIFMFLAFKFPIKPQWYSLLPIAVAVFLFTYCLLQNDPYIKFEEMLMFFGVGIVFLGILINIILYFRNKSLAKKAGK